MGLYRNLINFERNVEHLVYCKMVNHFEKKKIKNSRRVNIYEKIVLTNKQENEIHEYFKKYYGRKIDTRWHRLYQSFTGNFDKKYFPEILFSTKLEKKLSDSSISRQMTDKSMV